MCKRIDPEKTGQNLRRICKERKMSADKIAARLKLSDRRIVYYWFSGKKLPSLDRLYGLADILDVLVDDILVAQEKSEKWYFAYFRFVQGIGFLSIDDERQMPE